MMLRRTPLTRRTPLRSTAALVRKVAAKVQRRDTGPDQATRLLIWDRCNGYCEWPGCLAMATDVHHRLNRKAGGRKGAMREILNSPPWLLAACRFHHEFVTHPVGAERVQVEAWGWVLREGQHGDVVPAKVHQGFRYLTMDGRYET